MVLALRCHEHRQNPTNETCQFVSLLSVGLRMHTEGLRIGLVGRSRQTSACTNLSVDRLTYGRKKDSIVGSFEAPGGACPNGFFVRGRVDCHTYLLL